MKPMTARVRIPVEGQALLGTFLTPAAQVPGVLFAHGWGGSQESDLALAREIAALGCVCLTFDLRGHAATSGLFETVTREQNLNDLLAAYDLLCTHPQVDKGSIAVVGSSYGAYLSALLLGERAVRWLALRVPALYRDEDWSLAKRQFDRTLLAAYRSRPLSYHDNRALRRCAENQGDVLIVESEHDDLIPHETVISYRAAFRQVRSLSYRVISGADHALSDPAHRSAYASLLVDWVREMVLGSRGAGQGTMARETANVVA